MNYNQTLYSATIFKNSSVAVTKCFQLIKIKSSHVKKPSYLVAGVNISSLLYNVLYVDTHSYKSKLHILQQHTNPIKSCLFPTPDCSVGSVDLQCRIKCTLRMHYIVTVIINTLFVDGNVMCFAFCKS